MDSLFLLDTNFSCTNITKILNIAKFVLRAIQFIVPVLLILWGTIDLVKSVVAGKEEDIKKNQKTLVRRVISAVIVFLIPVAVDIILGLIGGNSIKDKQGVTWSKCWKDADPMIPTLIDGN